jgi:predicted RNase H-like nuclease (RuvC/YqgF family)
MEIKTVGVDKLFSLGNYNNERISMTANISEGENAEAVTAQLFLKITSIEDFFSMYRKVIDETDSVERQICHLNGRIEITQSELGKMKITLEELNEAINKGGDVTEERLNHACRSKSYKQVKEQLEREQAEREAYKKALDELKTLRSTLKERITKGVFNTDGLNVPIIPNESVYYG